MNGDCKNPCYVSVGYLVRERFSSLLGKHSVVIRLVHLRARNTALWSLCCTTAGRPPICRDTWLVDSYEGTAMLEWWANRSTCLARIGVRVAVGVTGNDWTCDATFEPSLTGEDRESFDFLMALDPLFTLRFDEATVRHVNVATTADDGRLSLTACQAEDAESAGTRRLPTVR